MNIKIHSLHFNADSRLLNFIESKVIKLDHFYDHILGAEVTLRLDRSDVTENKITEFRLQVPGYDLFSKKQAKTFEEATDTAIEAIRKQLGKTKEKQRGN
jgi:putative sigma-54 modulation protein